MPDLQEKQPSKTDGSNGGGFNGGNVYYTAKYF
jgi:hypothetical protein